MKIIKQEFLSVSLLSTDIKIGMQLLLRVLILKKHQGLGSFTSL